MIACHVYNVFCELFNCQLSLFEFNTVVEQFVLYVLVQTSRELCIYRLFECVFFCDVDVFVVCHNNTFVLGMNVPKIG